MPRLRIIILEKTGNEVDYVFWADVPAARQKHYAVQNAKSAWMDATAQDNANLASGAVTERSSKIILSGQTFQKVQEKLQSDWQNFQRAINQNNKWQRFGSTWDGTTWTIVNNP